MGYFSGVSLRLGSASRLAGFTLACGLAVSGFCVDLPAQQAGPKTMLALPPAPLLPATLGKLSRVAEGDSGDGLGSVDAADAAILTEDGLKRFAKSDYAAAAAGSTPGKVAGTIAAYKFGDASGAVAAYDYFRRPGMRPEKLGDDAVSDGTELLMRSGVNVVHAKITLGHDAMAALTTELIGHLPKVAGTAALPPMLPTLLPGKAGRADTLVAESVKYALGPLGYKAMGGVLPPDGVGFDKSAEIVTARYRSGGVLTLLLYPTPQIAGDHGRAIDAEMAREGASAGTVRTRREGPLVVLTSGAWPVPEAQPLVDGVHLRTELTWNKKMPLEFHAEVAKTYSLLSSIALLCGIGALAAIVMGLFFGGGRALIRVMQGKPAASEPEFLRINFRTTPASTPDSPPKA